MRKLDVNSHRLQRNTLPYLYIAPAFILLAIFVFKPFVFAIWKSFYKYDGAMINSFIGLDNYKNLFTNDPKFWISVQNLGVLFVGFLICFCSPLIIAEVLFNLSGERRQNFFRALLIIPIVVPSIVVNMVWKFMYYPQIGVFARIFESFGAEAPNFFGSAAWVKPAIILIGFPWVSGLPLLIYTAALQGIDTAVMEASVIDGAGRLRRILAIDIPLIIPQIKALFVLGIISFVQDYERFLILTQGGPNNASLVPGLHMYNVAFPAVDGSSEYGYSCAMAVLMFAAVMLVSSLALREKKEGTV